MRQRLLARSVFTIALLLATASFFLRLATRAAAGDSRQVSQLLEDIKNRVADLQRDSDELESFTRSNLPWESHADELARIKERINGQTIFVVISDGNENNRNQ